MKHPAETSAVAGTLAAGLASIFAYGRIDPAARIAMHWNIHGEPDRYAGRLEALGLLPALMLVLTLVLLAISRSSMGRRTRQENPSAWLAGWVGGFAVLLSAHLVILWNAISLPGDFAGLSPVLAVVSLVTIWIGNALPKTRPNPFVGVRTASTLADRGAWGASNRFAGWSFVLTGLATLGLVVSGHPAFAVQVLVAGLLVSAFVSILIGWLTRPR